MRKRPERYVTAVLPELRFEDEQFNIVLSAHFLFMYSDRLDYEFHKKTVHDLLDRLILELEADGLRVTEAKVPYEFMRNGNSLLSIRKM
ncbi:hypothetical protein [Paenibacillus polymyxa]|uniref:hypothetical protein n=1 Tax=Paenibacillus polymyxa TaxID=1406 RepID=UPI0004B3B76F|nr:hypothetical protein [Paenibacillus polymyxa]